MHDQDQSRNSTAPLDHPRAADRRLVLPFGERSKSRLRAVLDNGEEAGLFLERGSVLRHGDLLLADDGRVVEVQAAPRNRIDGAHRRRADAGARQLSPRQPARGAADRRRLAALPARSRARRHAARLRPRGASSSKRRSNPKEARMSRPRITRTRTHISTAEPSPRAPRRGRRARIAAAAAAVAPGEPGVAHRRVSFFAGTRIRRRGRLGDRRSVARSSG